MIIEPNKYYQLAKKLIEGDVVVMPTDTLYGIASLASNKNAVKRLYEIKNRKNKPGTVISANINELIRLGLNSDELNDANKFWPGPISIIINSVDGLSYLHQGKKSLAVRIPNDKNLKKLLMKTGPLLTSSANPPGQEPAQNIQQAKEYFKNKIDYYLDGGDMSGRPSTIAKIIDGQLEIIRPGAY